MLVNVQSMKPQQTGTAGTTFQRSMHVVLRHEVGMGFLVYTRVRVGCIRKQSSCELQWPEHNVEVQHRMHLRRDKVVTASEQSRLITVSCQPKQQVSVHGSVRLEGTSLSAAADRAKLKCLINFDLSPSAKQRARMQLFWYRIVDMLRLLQTVARSFSKYSQGLIKYSFYERAVL